MNITKHFVLILIFISFFGYSQNVEKGEIIKDRQFLLDKKEITANDNNGNFIAIRPHLINGSLNNYHIEFFKNLNFESRLEIETQNETAILKVFILNQKAHVFIKERLNGLIILRLDVIDLNSKLVTKKTLLKVDKSSDKSIFNALKENYFITLENASNIVLSFPVIENKVTYAYVKTFSQNLEQINQFNLKADSTISHRDTSFLNVKYLNNTIYALFQINNNDNNRFYRLIERTKNGSRTLDIPIQNNNYELINSQFKLNNLIIAGLYSQSKKGGFEGFTFYNIDLETFTLKANKQSLFYNEKAKHYFSGFFKGNRNIDINSIFIDSELNTYIVGQFYILKKERIPIGIPIASFAAGSISAFITINPVSTEHKVFDDVIVGKIDTKGNLEWDNILEFRQTKKLSSKSNKRDSTTFTYYANNQINIFINGFIDLEKKPIKVKQDKRLNKTNFYNITINQHGGITPNIVFPNLDSEIIFKAESAVKSNKNIHILGQGNMRKQLLKISL